jgi:hypothetical protein
VRRLDSAAFGQKAARLAAEQVRLVAQLVGAIDHRAAA